MQIGSVFCSHAAEAVESGVEIEIELQQDEWGWVSVCPECAPRRDRPQDIYTLVCGRCTAEWAAQTNSDYLERCKSALEETSSPAELHDT